MTTTGLTFGSLRILAASVLLLAGVQSADAAERSVPAQHPSIQAAINAASSGDTITVAPGTYNEAINFNGKNVHLRSAAGAEQTVIDATGYDTSVVTIGTNENQDAILEGFTITGGTGTLTGGYKYGGGIRVVNAAPLIDSCVVTGNSAQAGGGIQLNVGWGTIRNTLITHNTATGLGNLGGAGLHANLGNSLIENTQIIANDARSGPNGGGAALIGGDHTFVNTVIAYNIAYKGGGLRLNNSRANLINTTIAHNHAISVGGAMSIFVTSNGPTISNSIFSDNSSDLQDAQYQEIFAQGWSLTNINSSALENGWSGVGDGSILTGSTNFMNLVPVSWSGLSTSSLFELDLSQLDLSLAADSQAVDSGNNSYYTGAGLDLAGNERFVNGTIDLGALENQDEGPVPDECAADLDEDGMVGFRDLNMLLSNWGLCINCGADLDSDESVGGADLGIMLSSWGICG